MCCMTISWLTPGWRWFTCTCFVVVEDKSLSNCSKNVMLSQRTPRDAIRHVNFTDRKRIPWNIVLVNVEKDGKLVCRVYVTDGSALTPQIRSQKLLMLVTSVRDFSWSGSAVFRQTVTDRRTERQTGRQPTVVIPRFVLNTVYRRNRPRRSCSECNQTAEASQRLQLTVHRVAHQSVEYRAICHLSSSSSFITTPMAAHI